MQFSSVSEFFAMGGYGFYVWLSYGACFAIMVSVLISSVRAHKSTLTEVKSQISRENPIKKAQEQVQ